LKIVIVSHCQVVEEYQSDISALVDFGHKVTLITPAIYKEGGREVVATSLDSRTNHVPLSTIMGRKGKQHFHLYINVFRILKLLKTEKPDIFYLYEEPNSLVSVQMLILAKLASPNLKVIVWTACNTKRDYKAMYPVYDIRRYLFDANIKLSNKMASGIIAISNGAADVIRWKGWSKPIFVAPTHFIDPQRFMLRNTETSSVFKVGIIGRLQKQKGFDLVIEALGQIESDFSLDIYGEGEEQQALTDQASKNGILSKCNWHGNIPYAEIPKEIKSLDVLIVPSREIGHLKEQFGRVVIEAMSCGVNIIVSDSGYLPKLVGSLGLVFKKGVAVDLEEKIRYFSNQHNRFPAQTLRDHAIGNFSAKATAERLGSIFTSVLDDRVAMNAIVNVYGE
jgi:glycosyltransferase involved in cell wall biosynthesis